MLYVLKMDQLCVLSVLQLLFRGLPTIISHLKHRFLGLIMYSISIPLDLIVTCCDLNRRKVLFTWQINKWCWHAFLSFSDSTLFSFFSHALWSPGSPCSSIPDSWVTHWVNYSPLSSIKDAEVCPSSSPWGPKSLKYIDSYSEIISDSQSQLLWDIGHPGATICVQFSSMLELNFNLF